MQRRTFVKSVLGSAASAGLVGSASGRRVAGGNDPLDTIDIKTTEYGESHVFVPDEAENALYLLGYGNGYVQARDRLFEMDLLRHIGYGNSAEVVGPSQLPSDIQVRRDLYSPEEIDRQWAEASDTFREVVRGFADGVNRRITERAASGELPVEFAALGHAPEPWHPEDTVATINYLIGYFGVGGGSELANARTFANVQKAFGDEDEEGETFDDREAFEAYGDLNWLETTDDHYTSIPEHDLVVEGGEQVPDYEDVPEEQLANIDAALEAEPWGVETDVRLPEAITEGRREGTGLMESFKWGSNALIASGELTETGHPMLGGGPQMGFFKPPVPYEIGLHGAGFDCTGIGVAGAPAVVIGRTDTLAWTVTSGRDDQVDTIAVELDPDDKHRYKWEGEWYEMQTETVVHRASPVGSALAGETRVVEQEVARIEQEGDVMPVVAWNSEENVAWCQRVTTRYDELPGAFMWSEVGRAGDLEEFEEAIEEFPFTFNFHVVEYDEDAGRENIAYYHTGKVPDRGGDRDFRFPATPETHEWSGMQVGLGLGTHIRNPSSGYIVNWNNGPVAGWRAGDSEQNWGSRHRVDQLDHFVRERLGVDEDVPRHAVPAAASESLSLADIRELVFDAARHDNTAQVSVPYLAGAALDSDDEQLRAMGEELQRWADDYCPWGTEGDADGVYPGHTIYDAARTKLQNEVFSDELGDSLGALHLDPPAGLHAAHHGNASEDVTFLDALALETTHDWFSDVSVAGPTTPDAATRDEVIRNVLRDLASQFDGDDPSQWRGEPHQSEFTVLGLTEPESIPIMNRATYNQAIAFGPLSPSMKDKRAELSKDGQKPPAWTLKFRDVMPPANSGHVNAVEGAQVAAGAGEPERVDDQLGLYVSNEYKPHPVTEDQVDEVTVSSKTIRATPERPGGPVTPAAPESIPAESVFPTAGSRPDESTATPDAPDESAEDASDATDTVEDRLDGL